VRAKGIHGHKIRIARPLVIASDQADRALEPISPAA
jgi:4-aminobutyrate aminotransferase-like enzyme